MDDPGKVSAAMKKEPEAKLLAPGVNPCLIPRWKCYEPVERIRNEGQKAEKKLVVDVVMIGDSITAGWGGKGAAAFRKYVNGWNIFNMACSGDQIQDQPGNCLWGGLDGYQAKIVQIMIGTNNARNDTPENMAGGIRRTVEPVRGKQPDAHVFPMPAFPRGEATRPHCTVCRGNGEQRSYLSLKNKTVPLPNAAGCPRRPVSCFKLPADLFAIVVTHLYPATKRGLCRPAGAIVFPPFRTDP